MQIHILHHVSITVSDLERSRQFYREILQLTEIERPPFGFPGAWFGVGGGSEQHVHLIVHEHATFRGMKGIDTRDIHFAVRTRSFREAVEFLKSKGYSEDADDSRFHSFAYARTNRMDCSASLTASVCAL